MRRANDSPRDIANKCLYLIHPINLDNLTLKDLQNLIQKCGRYQHSSIFSHPKGNFAFLIFEHDVDRENLFSRVNKYVPNIQSIVNVDPLNIDEIDDLNIIYVTHYLYSIDSKELEKMIKSFSFHLKILNRYDHLVIQTNDTSNAIICRRFLNSLSIDNHKLFVSKSRIKPLPMILVKKIPYDFNTTELKELFHRKCQRSIYSINTNPSSQNFNRSETDDYSARITFHDIECAEKAVLDYNFTTIDGKEISVELFLPDFSVKNDMKTWKLIINNIPPNLMSLQLFRLFKPFGDLHKVKIVHSNSKHYGVINYYQQETSQKVEEMVNYSLLNGYEIKTFHLRTIKILNFMNSTQKEEILEMFVDYNPFSIKMIQFKDRRPIVYLSFQNDKDMEGAIEHANQILSLGMKLSAYQLLLKNGCADKNDSKHENINENNSSVDEKHRYIQKNTIHFSNLPNDYMQEDLINLCMSYGTLVYISLMTKPSQQNRENTSKTGVVEFDDEESAKRAITSLEGLQINGNPIKISLYTPFKKHSKR
ncbi:hypothetical protein TRFO_09253 [Tritrichomonas foetus]|uniref:RRM domain-containing protein n=1 Tax=Tritrichomonas foetus TaxID=1144522 RepID=A0A1J4JFD4_9EUKA|nr:hypothetical protein TRFO_09253 [Tritrichomonas foetus]|eukprot:OHS97824.1 hypothetical protein TRFO_09253 [Tritrichomonas foetus]